jgi:hypothetical protein
VDRMLEKENYLCYHRQRLSCIVRVGEVSITKPMVRKSDGEGKKK